MPRIEGYMQQHPEWTKPVFPYVKGAKFLLYTHKPPSPPPERLEISAEDIAEWCDFDPVARCLTHPPPGGTNDSGSVNIEIIGAIHAGDGKHAQVVRVRVDSDEINSQGHYSKLPSQSRSDIVAKIYDPLYFDHEQHEFDPFKIANAMYPMESSVYVRLSSLQGRIMPKYYGSFTCSLPVRPGQSRAVRVVLIDFIQGHRMLDLSPIEYDQQQRQEIMAGIVDAETAVYTKNVTLMDMAPRNVILTSLPGNDKSKINNHQTNTQPQEENGVVLLDFDSAYLGRECLGLLQCFGEEYYLPGVYISPLIRWPNMGCVELFEDWVDWDWTAWIHSRYAHDEATITEHMIEVWKKD